MSSEHALNVALRMAKPDWTVAQMKELAQRLDQFWLSGMSDAASMARSWGNEADGGFGQGGEGYNNLANAIMHRANEKLKEV